MTACFQGGIRRAMSLRMILRVAVVGRSREVEYDMSLLLDMSSTTCHCFIGLTTDIAIKRVFIGDDKAFVPNRSLVLNGSLENSFLFLSSARTFTSV